MARITLEAKDLLTVEEAAGRLACQPITVWRWVNKGKLVSTKIAGRRLIPLSEIERVLAEQAAESGVDSSDNG